MGRIVTGLEMGLGKTNQCYVVQIKYNIIRKIKQKCSKEICKGLKTVLEQNGKGKNNAD